LPRKGPAPKRQLKPDEVFGSRLVSRFINKILLGGRKSAAEKIFYGAMQLVGERTGENPLVVLRNAMRNVMPNLEVRPRRVGGATYQVPVEVDTRRQLTLTVRWMVGAMRARGERTAVERMAGEILDAANREGASVRKREEMHRMAEANKAYSHYRW
jgi:small subunit ribosomal protein S7